MDTPDNREDTGALQEDMARLRRDAAAERARLARRRSDRAKLAEMERRAQEVDPAARPAAERLAASLRRRLDDAVLLDGDDDALAGRLKEIEQSLQQRSDALAGQRRRAAAPPPGAEAPRDRAPPPDRARQRRVERLDAEIDATEDELRTHRNDLRTDGGQPDAAPAPASNLALQRIDALELDARRLLQAAARRARQLHLQRIAGEQMLRRLDEGLPASAAERIEALGRHLREEYGRTLAELERHWTTQWAEIVRRADVLVIQRLAGTHAIPDIDPDFEIVSLRDADLAVLASYLRFETWQLMQAAAGQLPRRSRQAFLCARGDAASGRAAPDDLLVPPLPAAATLALARKAGALDDLQPLGRIDAAPGVRWRRGDYLAAIGRFAKEVTRAPMAILGPLGFLTMFGISLNTELKGLAKEYWGVGALVLVLAILLSVYTFWRKSMLAEKTVLERGKTQLRDLLRKRGELAWQEWRQQLADHGERSIRRALALLAEAAPAAVNPGSGARERQLAESQVRDAGSLLKRLEAGAAALRRLRERRVPELRAALRALEEGGP